MADSNDKPKTPKLETGTIPKATAALTSPAAPAPVAAVKKGQKRRRTRSHNSSPSPGRGFFVPGFENGSGFKMMSLNEIMDATRGITNMYLAHEIAVDKDFMLEKLKKEETGMEAEVKKIVHQVIEILKQNMLIINAKNSQSSQIKENLYLKYF